MWPSEAAPERGIFVARQVEALRTLGHDVEVAPLTDVRTGRLRTPLKYLRLARDARRRGTAQGPDVVHGHFLLPTGAVARMTARRLGVPYVVTAHGTDVRNAEGSARLRARTEPVVREAALVVAVSDALAVRLRELYPGLRVEVCDMGVDDAIFTPVGEGTPPAASAPRFVAVGSLLANKNHERLLRAVAGIDGARLVCIGEGEQRATLERLAVDLGMRDRFALPGRFPHADLATWYRGATAACLVSIDEGFGLAALEAIACGCPVVVSQTAPVSELVTPRGPAPGTIVDPHDVDDIANGLRAAATLPHADAPTTRTAIAGRTLTDRARELAALLEDALARAST